MRKRLIRVIAIVAVTLGLILGPGVVSKAAPPRNTPLALDGGGSGA